MRRAATVFGAMAAIMWLVGPGARAAACQTTRSVYISVFDDDGQQVHGVTPGDLTLKQGGYESAITSVAYPSERMHLTILVEEVLAPIYNVRLGIFELAKRLIPQADISLVLVGNRDEILVAHTGNINAVVEGLNLLDMRRKTGKAGNIVEAVLEVAQRIEQAAPARPAMIVVALETPQASSVQPGLVLDQLRKSRAVFHSVAVGDPGGAWTPNAGAAATLGANVSAVAMLGEMAARGQVLGDGPRQSGGHRVELRSTDRVRDALKEVGDELSAQYSVTYELPEGVRSEDRLEVSIDRRGAELRAPTRIAD